MDRRDFLKTSGLAGAAIVGGTPILASCHGGGETHDFGPLQPSGVPNLLIPQGFTARLLATTGQEVQKSQGGGTGQNWHFAPDGGAVFPIEAGGAPVGSGGGGDALTGWIYVSNSEVGSNLGGVVALEFDAAGDVVDCYVICFGTNRNCAGGAMPWHTWVTCEEVTQGYAVECDPYGVNAAVPRPAMGRFKREAVAYHPGDGASEPARIYQTEDRSDGGFYRFTPDTPGDLSSGLMEVMTQPTPGNYVWVEVPDPDGDPVLCHDQVPDTRRFNGGEGIWYTDGLLYFTTKGDNRVWAYSASENFLLPVYDDQDPYPTPRDLTGVDNVLAAPHNKVFVAEDGGNNQIVSLDPSDGSTYPVVQYDITGTEITGPAFDPSGTRLYFSSQRNPGETFEVAGPWNA